MDARSPATLTTARRRTELFALERAVLRARFTLGDRVSWRADDHRIDSRYDLGEIVDQFGVHEIVMPRCTAAGHPGCRMGGPPDSPHGFNL